MLTGVAAGEKGPDGRFPEGSLNRKICERLIGLAEQRRAFAGRGGGKPAVTGAEIGAENGNGEESG